MGDILRIEPNLHFPFCEPFQVLGHTKGQKRGTWFYRSAFTNSIWGPFRDEAEAEAMMWLEGNPTDFPQ